MPSGPRRFAYQTATPFTKFAINLSDNHVRKSSASRGVTRLDEVQGAPAVQSVSGFSGIESKEVLR